MIAEDSVRFAHSGPSQRILRGLSTTCLRRAPPPAHVRGWTCLRNRTIRTILFFFLTVSVTLSLKLILYVILYAYLQNIHSGRKMEALIKRDVNFMWLSGMQLHAPNTINLFRKNRLVDVMDDIFTQVVQMLVDGTKIEANANKYTFVWKKATKTNQDKLDLKDESDNVMTAEDMQDRTDEILA